MLKILIRRIIQLVPVLFLVSLFSYSLVLFIPGDAAAIIAGDAASPERVEEVREQLGLHEPFIVQYGRWVGGVLQGDLGETVVRRQPVTEMILDRLPITAQLAAVAMVMATLIGIPLGIIAAPRAGSLTDRIASLVAALGMAAPQFWIAQVLILLFAFQLGWLPASGWTPFTEDPGQWLRTVLIPGFAIASGPAAVIMRQLRSQLQGTLNEDFVRTARAAGLHEWRVVGKHAMRSALSPVVTIMGLQLGSLISGTVIVESVMGIPGLGTLALRAVAERDLPLIQGVILFAAFAMIAINLVVDMIYRFLNPKLREASL